MSCSTTTTECSPASDSSSSAVRSVSCGVMPGDRLVDQQQLRVLHQQHADLEPLLLAVRQRAARASSRCSRQADDLEHLVDAVALRRRQAGHAASSRTTCRRPAPARDSRTPSAARTPSASETFGRCRPARSPARSASAGRCVRPNQAVPASGRVLPVITSIIVVLPAPFGPMMQRSSPGSTYSVSSLSALKPSKLTVSFSR